MKVTSKELYILTAMMDYEDVLGIPNAFEDVSEEKLANEISELQKSLEEKGLIESSFSGDSTISEECQKIIDAMAEPDNFIYIERQLKKDNDSCAIYIKGKEAIISLEKNYEHDIKSIELKDIEKTIYDKVVDIKEKVLPKFEGDYLQSDLEELKVNNKKKLIDNKDILNVLLKGFNAKSNYYTLTFAKPKENYDNFKNLLFIDDEDGVIQLEPSLIDYQDAVKISSSSKEKVMKELKTDLAWIFQEVTDECLVY